MARAHIFLLCFLIAISVRAEKLFVSIRGAEDRLAQHCSSPACKENILKIKTQEFENGNTFVKVMGSVAGKQVQVFTPEKFNANQFMELLVLVRALKNEFAADIEVSSFSKGLYVVAENGTQLIPSFLAREFVYLAGASKIFNAYRWQTPSHPSYRIRSQSVIWADQQSQLAQNVSKDLMIPFVDFADSVSVADTRVFLFESFNENYNENFLKALGRAYSVVSRKASVTLISPYLPYARSDKKDQRGVAITGRLAADLIEASGVDSIVFVRAHAPQSEGFFSIPTLQISGRKTINNFLQEKGIEVVVSPDAGFQKDATLYADDLKVPVSVVNKQRNLETGKAEIKGISGESVSGKRVVIIDDETASGSTLAKAAQLLKALGATYVVGVVTHLAGKADQATTSAHLDEVVVTDSLPVKSTNDKLKVLSLARETADDIREYLMPQKSGTLSTCRKKVLGF